MIIRREELTCYGPLLAQRHGVVSEYPVVAGTGISVHRLGLVAEEGYTPESLVAEFLDRLTVEQVVAALACFRANRELFIQRVDEDERESEIEAAALAATAPAVR